MKRCCKCKMVMPESEFYKSKHSSDGRQSYCKVCNAIRQRQYRAKKNGELDENIFFAGTSRPEREDNFYEQQLLKKQQEIQSKFQAVEDAGFSLETEAWKIDQVLGMTQC